MERERITDAVDGSKQNKNLRIKRCRPQKTITGKNMPSHMDHTTMPLLVNSLRSEPMRSGLADAGIDVSLINLFIY